MITAPEALGLPIAFEVVAIFAGALSGGIVAVNHKFDVTGVLVLALVNGLGGGLMRDLLIQNQGVFALQTPRVLLAVLGGAVIAMFFTSIAERLRPALLAVDALSLALFCIAGADKALVAGLNGISAVLVGAITAVGGGLLRDIVCNREPEIVRRGSLYGIAAIAGSIVYVGMVAWLGLARPAAMIVAGLVALALRLGALLLGWESPEPIDLSQAVITAPRQAVGGTVTALRRLTGGLTRRPTRQPTLRRRPPGGPSSTPGEPGSTPPDAPGSSPPSP